MNLSAMPYLPRIWWNPDYIEEQEEKDKERRPFKNKEEANHAGFDLLDNKGKPNTLYFRVKGDEDTEAEVMITGISDTDISFNGATYSYQYLFEQYEWFDGNRWAPFGTFEKEEEKEKKEEKEEKEAKQGIAKFKRAHKYYCGYNKYFTVLDKFLSPTDGQVYIVIETANLEEILIEPYLVYRTPVGDEYIWIKDHAGKTHLAFASKEVEEE